MVIENLCSFVLQSTFNMKSQEHLETLKDIRKMMNRSIKFLSLSGLSGVFIGVYALIAGYLAYSKIEPSFDYNSFSEDVFGYLLSLALITLVFSVSTGFLLTYRKARKEGLTLWDESTKTALLNLSIPLIMGGVFCIALIRAEQFVFLAPITLIFYGIALANMSRYTFGEIRQLGLLEIALGLISAFFLEHGLIFWMIGFGILHIIYGIYMHFKYDRR